MKYGIRLTLLVFAMALLGFIGWAYMAPRRTAPTHDELLAETRDADRIVVRLGAFGRDQSRHFTSVFEIAEREAIQELLRKIEWAGSSPRCACEGNYTIEFYAGDKLLVTLGYQHAKNLRWKKRWGDLELTAESRAAIPDWFAKRGFTGFRELVDDERGWHERN
jgi:hypothetical protein